MLLAYEMHKAAFDDAAVRKSGIPDLLSCGPVFSLYLQSALIYRFPCFLIIDIKVIRWKCLRKLYVPL